MRAHTALSSESSHVRVARPVGRSDTDTGPSTSRPETGLRLSGVGLRSSAGCDETTERLSDDADGDWSAWWLVSRLLMSTACASR